MNGERASHRPRAGPAQRLLTPENVLDVEAPQEDLPEQSTASRRNAPASGIDGVCPARPLRPVGWRSPLAALLKASHEEEEAAAV